MVKNLSQKQIFRICIGDAELVDLPYRTCSL